jgi:hypothetical protein
MEKAVELTQNSAKLALNGAVQTAELAEGYVQGLYKLGYDTNMEGLKVAKNYWDTASKIRQDWIKLFAATGEHVIETAAKVEFPYQDKVTEFGKGIVDTVEKTFENVMPKTKAAAK